MAEKNCQGKCPYCDGGDITYGGSIIEDGYHVTSLVCNTCGKEAQEVYQMVYQNTEFDDT